MRIIPSLSSCVVDSHRPLVGATKLDTSVRGDRLGYIT